MAYLFLTYNNLSFAKLAFIFNFVHYFFINIIYVIQFALFVKWLKTCYRNLFTSRTTYFVPVINYNINIYEYY